MRPAEHDITENQARIVAVLTAQRDIASANLEYSALIQLILDRVSSLLSADGACMEIAEGDEMVYEAATGIASGFVGMRLKAAGSLSGLSMTNNQLLRSDDTESDPRVDREACRRIGLRSMFVMPLRYDDHSFGVLKVMSAKVAAFTAEDEQALQLMGEFLGVTVARQRAMAALREREERLRMQMERMPIGCIIFDHHNCFRELNPAAERILGYTSEELRGRDGSIIVPEHARAQVDSIMRRLGEGDMSAHAENENVTKDGRVITCLWNNTPLLDESGNFIGFLSMVQDITERKRAETRLRRFFDTDLFAILHWTIEGGVIDVNNKFLNMTGYTREDLKAGLLNWSRMTPPEYHAMDEDARRQIRETGVHLPYEKQYIRKDGSRVWALFAAAAWDDKRNEGVSFIVDIDDRKRAEEELRLATERFQVALKGSPIVVFNQDLDLRYTWIHNPALGYKAGAVIGKRDIDVFERMEDGEVTEAIKRDVIRTGVSRREEVLIHWQGVDRYYDLQVDPLRNSDGEIVGVTCAAVDVTEQKQAQAALLRSEKLASVGRMAATIAHEINNPLASITNALYLAKNIPGVPEAALEFLTMADEELRRVTHITRQSLGFYRESQGAAVTSVHEVLDSVLELLKNKIKVKSAHVEKQWDGDVCITAVSGELRQVFSNFLTNSLDAIGNHGTIKVRVSNHMTMGNQRRAVRITVADNGCGLSASSQRRMFEPFFTTKGAVGTGLGLWVSKQIIDRHEGTIRVRSCTGEERHGTVISVVLPIDGAAEFARPAAAGSDS